MSDKPTVGMIVHFYDHSRPDESSPEYRQVQYRHKRRWFHFGTSPGIEREVEFAPANKFGPGPYPAVIIQTFGGKPLANILVLGWEGPWREEAVDLADAPREEGRYFIFPPRV